MNVKKGKWGEILIYEITITLHVRKIEVKIPLNSMIVYCNKLPVMILSKIHMKKID